MACCSSLRGRTTRIFSKRCLVLGGLVILGVIIVSGLSRLDCCALFSRSSSCTKYPQTTKIPKIIHQTWSTYTVPESFSVWIQSWLKYNPDWEYWYWSDKEIEMLLSVKYPELRHVFMDLYKGIQRGDAIRYLALYEIGGMYADMDMECVKPLHHLLSSYNCFLSEENYEHVTLLYHKKEPIMINCVMGCRPEHSFYKRVIDGLPRSENPDVMSSTGPLFLTDVFKQFQQQPGLCIYDHITSLPPRYLLPMSDMRNPGISRMCHQNATTPTDRIYITNPSVDIDQKEREAEMCKMLADTSFQPHIYSESLTIHHWIHSWLYGFREKNFVHIETLVPNVKFFGKLHNGTQTSKYYPRL